LKGFASFSVRLRPVGARVKVWQTALGLRIAFAAPIRETIAKILLDDLHDKVGDSFGREAVAGMLLVHAYIAAEGSVMGPQNDAMITLDNALHFVGLIQPITWSP
jgi:hypothetical protein